MAAFGIGSLPLAVLTDSYKACHPLMYPDAERMVAYGEFRKGFRTAEGHDCLDTRVISYGIRYVVETYLERRWTLADVQAAAQFYRCCLLSIAVTLSLTGPAAAHTTRVSRSTRFRESCSRSLCARTTVRPLLRAAGPSALSRPRQATSR